MKHKVFFIALCTLALTGCGLTRIVTVYPDQYTTPTSYTTSVTLPRTRTTTTTRVTAVNEDICLALDLQAVAAAFAQSSTVREFENLLNDSSFMLSNLDLNGDGYVDYLRVIETVEGYNHVFLIQSVIGNNVYQDVATLVAEMSSSTSAYVQVIGAPYVYGVNYIVRPVFLVTPRIYAHLWHPAYVPWHSPWYWGYYPPCYRRPAPLHIGHYQAYVHTYMNNHRYCREVYYDNSCHYTNYNIINVNVQRNDYAVQHPERTFSERTAKINTPTASSSAVKNARDITAAHASAATVETTSSRTASSNSGASRSASASRTATATPAAPAATTSSRTATTSRTSTTATSRPSATATTSRPATTTTTSSRTATTSRTAATATTSRATTTSHTSSSSASKPSTTARKSTVTTGPVSGTSTTSSRVKSTGKVSTSTRTTAGSRSATPATRTATSTTRATTSGTRTATSTTRATTSGTRTSSSRATVSGTR